MDVHTWKTDAVTELNSIDGARVPDSDCEWTREVLGALCHAGNRLDPPVA